MLYLSGMIVAAAAGLVLIGLGRRRRAIDIGARLAHFGERVAGLEEQELEKPFVERVVRPMVRSWALRLGRLSPSQNTAKLRTKLAEAGSPSGIGPIEFVGLRLLLCLGLAVGSFFMFGLAGGAGSSGFLLTTALAVFGYLMPNIWLDRKAKARKKVIQRALPDAIDLMAISVEAGLGFDLSMLRVAEKWDNSLSHEFGRVLSEMRIGKTKRESLREMCDRCGVDDLNTFVGAVIQADQLGVAITQVIRVQADAMRVRRRQRAQELAQKAPIKMLFPMAFLIFPALYVVILGPAVPKLVAAFSGS